MAEVFLSTSAVVLIIVFFSAYAGMAAHEAIHFWLAARFDADAEMIFTWNLPAGVDIESFEGMTDTQIRLFMFGPAFVFGPVFLVYLYLMGIPPIFEPQPITESLNRTFRLAFLLMLLAAGHASPADILGLLRPGEIRTMEGREDRLTNNEALSRLVGLHSENQR